MANNGLIMKRQPWWTPVGCEALRILQPSFDIRGGSGSHQSFFFFPLPFGLAWRAVFGSYQQLMSHSAIFVIQTQSWSITLFQMKGELTKKDCQCDVWECLPVPSGTEENLDTSIQRRGIREHVSFLIKNDQSQFMEKNAWFRVWPLERFKISHVWPKYSVSVGSQSKHCQFDGTFCSRNGSLV